MPPVWTYAWALVVLAAVLIAASVTDVRSGKIYNYLTYPAIAIGLIGHTLVGGLTGGEDRLGFVGALAGFGVGFIPMLVAWFAGGINGGDAKLMGAVGALAGWRLTLAAMFYGFAVAALMAVAVMLQRHVLKETMGRIVRFLYLCMTPGRPPDPATKDSPKVPFGLALCIGTALAIVETLIRGPAAARWPFGI